MQLCMWVRGFPGMQERCGASNKFCQGPSHELPPTLQMIITSSMSQLSEGPGLSWSYLNLSSRNLGLSTGICIWFIISKQAYVKIPLEEFISVLFAYLNCFPPPSNSDMNWKTSILVGIIFQRQIHNRVDKFIRVFTNSCK